MFLPDYASHSMQSETDNYVIVTQGTRSSHSLQVSEHPVSIVVRFLRGADIFQSAKVLSERGYILHGKGNSSFTSLPDNRIPSDHLAKIAALRQTLHHAPVSEEIFIYVLSCLYRLSRQNWMILM